MADLERAIEIAALAHRRQLQKDGQPYILHPLTLMFAVDGEIERIVAVLHDVVEDSDWSFADLESEGFAPRVIEVLRLLTHDPEVDYVDYVEAIAADPVAAAVKRADLRHNLDLLRITEVTDKDLERARKYHRAYRRLESL